MRTILLVEDEPRFRRILASYLTRQGYLVEDYDSGKAALCRMERCIYDVLITDYQLKDAVNGFDLTARFAQLWPKKGKIVMSGRAEFQPRCESLGALYITKPFSLDALTAKIENVLPQVSFMDTSIAEMIDRARSQRAWCLKGRGISSRQRLLCNSARQGNKEVRENVRNLQMRMADCRSARHFSKP